MQAVGVMVQRSKFVSEDGEGLLRFACFERLEELLLPESELHHLEKEVAQE